MHWAARPPLGFSCRCWDPAIAQAPSPPGDESFVAAWGRRRGDPMEFPLGSGGEERGRNASAAAACKRSTRKIDLQKLPPWKISSWETKSWFGSIGPVKCVSICKSAGICSTEMQPLFPIAEPQEKKTLWQLLECLWSGSQSQFPLVAGAHLRWEVIAPQLFIRITSNSRTFWRGLFNFRRLLEVLTSPSMLYSESHNTDAKRCPS